MDGTTRNTQNSQADAIVDELMADVITGRPHDFTVGDETYYLWPMTLAKRMLLKPYFESMGLGETEPRRTYGGVLKQLLDNVTERRAECAMMLSILTMPNTRTAFFDYVCRKKRTEFFSRELQDVDIAQLLATALTGNHVRHLSVHFGMDRERERLSDALRAKEKSKNNLSFGSVSVLGSFVVPLLKMGFRYDEVVFERSYDLLQLMLLDEPVSLWLSDEELDNADGAVGADIDGESDNADEQLLAFFANKGVRVIDKNEEV